MHTQSRQAHIDGIVMTRTCLIRPVLWQGSRSDRDSSIIRRTETEKTEKKMHMLTGECNRGG